jgi:hypothetical protein
MQPFETAGPDGVGELGPNLLCSYDASDIAWVVPVPGLTGLAITSRRSHNLMEPVDRLDLISASVSRVVPGSVPALAKALHRRSRAPRRA